MIACCLGILLQPKTLPSRILEQNSTGMILNYEHGRKPVNKRLGFFDSYSNGDRCNVIAKSSI